MTADRDPRHARRYLLGQTDEPAADAFEDAMFRDTHTLEHAEAEEDTLIEDFLGERLTPDERAQFERHYLAAPHHRVRVETVRRLIAATRTRSRRRAYFVPLAAAAVLILAAGGWWMYSLRTAPVVETRVSPPASRDRNLAAPVPPRIFATSLSPITLRSAGAGAALVIPEGTDVVSLRLMGEGDRPHTARVILRTVAGAAVWQGDAAVSDLPAGAIARVDVPASVLHRDDYIVDLNVGPAGRELYRYVLRVRGKP